MKVRLKERKEYDVVVSMSIDEAKRLRLWLERHSKELDVLEVDNLYNQLYGLIFP